MSPTIGMVSMIALHPKTCGLSPSYPLYFARRNREFAPHAGKHLPVY